MAYIKVDYSYFQKTADVVEDYIYKRRQNMKLIDNTVSSLNAVWKGQDYDQVKKEWTEINSEGSTEKKTETVLNAYANALNEAGTKYREAQARAINRANVLCK